MTWLLLIIGIFACSTSAIFIKASTMHPAYLAALRLFMATLLLMPVFIHHWRRQPHLSLGQLFGAAWIPGILLGLHFITWNEGARLTLAAHATLIVNMVPLALPVLLWLTQKEGVNGREKIATAFSMLGIGFLAWQDYQFSQDYLRGDFICFISMILFAAYLALGRKNRGVASVFLYVIPVYLVAAVVCMAIALLHWDQLLQTEPSDYWMALGLALVPTIIGHSLINYAMRRLRGQVVGVLNVGQFVFSGILAFFLFKEVPPMVFYLVSVFVVLSCLVVMFPSEPKRGAR